MSGLRRIVAAILTRDETRPVQVGHTSPPLAPVPVDGTPKPEVVLVLDLERADILAKALIRLDAILDRESVDFTFDGELWNHAAIELLSSVALSGPLPFPVHATAVAGVDSERWFA